MPRNPNLAAIRMHPPFVIGTAVLVKASFYSLPYEIPMLRHLILPNYKLT